MPQSLEPIYTALRDRMLRSGHGMVVDRDESGNLILLTPWIEPGKKTPAWFGTVQLKKNYVSVHLMPLYAIPSLGDDLPPELMRRMQGKSCFNFKSVDPDLFDALERLIDRCAQSYAQPVTPQPH